MTAAFTGATPRHCDRNIARVLFDDYAASDDGACHGLPPDKSVGDSGRNGIGTRQLRKRREDR